jgi:hypothetical protein
MLEVAQHLERLLDDGVRLFALDVDHKADTARFMLEAWIVKSLFRWRDGLHPRRVFGSLSCFTGHFLAIIVAFCSLIFDINYAVSQWNVFWGRISNLEIVLVLGFSAFSRTKDENEDEDELSDG